MTSFPKPARRKREAVKVYPDGREVCSDTTEGKREYQSRLFEMERRQGFECALCPNDMFLTFDHQAGRGHGGGHRDDRILVDGEWQNAALCYHCNHMKGSKRYHWKDGKYVPAS
jgi:hypothetical protein